MFTEKQKEIRRRRALEWNKNNALRMNRNQKRWRDKNRHILKVRRKQKISEDPSILAKERASAIKFIKNNPWYYSYSAAKQRCLNPKNTRYKDYGGRGIRFMLSKQDTKYLWDRDSACSMVRPSIDRIDNNGDYSIFNCRFIEASDNSRKKKLDNAIQSANITGLVVSLGPAVGTRSQYYG